jgi:hypothetical protein
MPARSTRFWQKMWRSSGARALAVLGEKRRSALHLLVAVERVLVPKCVVRSFLLLQEVRRLLVRHVHVRLERAALRKTRRGFHAEHAHELEGRVVEPAAMALNEVAYGSGLRND